MLYSTSEGYSKQRFADLGNEAVSKEIKMDSYLLWQLGVCVCICTV